MRFVDVEILLNRVRERKLIRTRLLVNQGRLKKDILLQIR